MANRFIVLIFVLIFGLMAVLTFFSRALAQTPPPQRSGALKDLEGGSSPRSAP